MNITIKEIQDICTKNHRVVPCPAKWNMLYKKLKGKIQKANGNWNPPLPLILSAWHHSSPEEKQLRLKEHIQWTANQKQENEIFNFLASLNEEDWFHWND